MEIRKTGISKWMKQSLPRLFLLMVTLGLTSRTALAEESVLSVSGGGEAQCFFTMFERGDLLFDMDPQYGRINGTATGTFGEGGNYIPENERHKSDQIASLRGKIDNGGVSPRIEGTGEDARVVFEAGGNTSGNDRSELAAGPQFPFGEVYEIRYKFRYDGPVHETGHFYLLQIWQAVYSPLAGIRMVPGTGDTVEFVGRGVGAAASATLTPGQWVDWTARLKVGPDGFIKVYDAKGNKLGEVSGDFGYTGPGDPQQWRPKFGIYKTANSGNFKVEVSRFVLKHVMGTTGEGGRDTPLDAP